MEEIPILSQDIPQHLSQENWIEVNLQFNAKKVAVDLFHKDMDCYQPPLQSLFEIELNLKESMLG